MLRTIRRTLLVPLMPAALPLIRWRNRRELARFESGCDEAAKLVGMHKFGCSPEAAAGDQALQKVEAIRQRLLKDDSPLDTGDLGGGVPWDANVTIADACRSSRSQYHAAYLYGLVRRSRPKKVLELGTNLGVSGAYIAAALQANGGGELVTMDASPYRQRIAKKLFEEAGLRNAEFVLGNFDDTFDSTVQELGPFEFAFIDGNHSRDPTLHYSRTITNSAGGPVVIVFDDIRWSDGMFEAWRQLQRDPQMVAGLDLYRISIAIMDAGNQTHPCLSKPLFGAFR